MAGCKNRQCYLFCSLAVLRGDFVKLYNLVHGLTGLTPLVHFFGIKINHLVGAMPGDGLNLTVGAASFQEVDGCVLAKVVKRVVFVEAAQPETSPLWLMNGDGRNDHSAE